MNKDSSLLKKLEIHGLSNIDIDQILNYLETLDYDLKRTRYIGKLIAKNEHLNSESDRPGVNNDSLSTSLIDIFA